MLTYTLAAVGAILTVIFTALIGPLIVAERKVLWSLWQARRDARQLRKEANKQRKLARKRDRDELRKLVAGEPYLNTALDLYIPSRTAEEGPFIRIPFRRQWIERVMRVLDRLPIWGPDTVVQVVPPEEYAKILQKEAKNLHTAKHHLKMATDQLATELMVQRQTVEKWEAGEERIPPAIWRHIRVLLLEEKARRERED